MSLLFDVHSPGFCRTYTYNSLEVREETNRFCYETLFRIGFKPP